jgi:CubicO group peptidase (beta-lactamase class C family)
LARIGAAHEAGVQAGEIPGAVIIVARDGELVYEAAVGFRNLQSQQPMTRTTRFHLASMTKPIVSVAALMLVEDELLQLDAHVCRYLPELAGLSVAREILDVSTGARRLHLEPSPREPTILDLLRHTAGFTYGPFGNSLVQQAYEAADVMDPEQTNAELTSKLAALPLAYPPGEVFEYGMSTDILGRVIEVVSNQSLDLYIQRRVTGPLGMTDTSFAIADPDRIALARNACRPASGAPRWLSGGGGLIGTASDYLQFAQMLLNRGELHGARLLSSRTVDLMTRNHLPAGALTGPYNLEALAPTAAMGQGFGLGLCVRLEQGRNPLPGSIGDYSWAGSTGTYFWVDPRERLIGLSLTAASEMRTAYRAKARTLVYQALR